MKKCQEYILGNAKEEYFLKNKVVFCHAKVCPYDKEFVTTFEGENMTFCTSKGLLKKVEIDNPNKDKKSNKPLILPETNFKNIGDISKVRYLQFTTPENPLSL
jgi:hypothetical protein